MLLITSNLLYMVRLKAYFDKPVKKINFTNP